MAFEALSPRDQVVLTALESASKLHNKARLVILGAVRELNRLNAFEQSLIEQTNLNDLGQEERALYEVIFSQPRALALNAIVDYRVVAETTAQSLDQFRFLLIRSS